MRLLLLITLFPQIAFATAWRERYKSYEDVFSALTPIEGCASKLAEPLLAFEKLTTNPKGKRILVLSLIHGNEPAAGVMGFRWIKRLQKINPHNSWLILPVVNPDGVAAQTRTNANGVDLNRHFPTENWEPLAHAAWKKAGSPKAKFPGDKPGVEPEMQCLLKVIEDYKPDLIASLHIPFALLDYDGPGKVPVFLPMKWKRLGHYPGSLGRYAWAERKIPVITVELPEMTSEALLKKMDRFQDELSYLAK